MPIRKIKKAYGALKAKRKAGTMKRAAKAKGQVDKGRKKFEGGYVWGASKGRGVKKTEALREAKVLTGSREFRKGQTQGLRIRKKVRTGAAVAAGGAGAYALSRRKKKKATRRRR